MKVSHELIPNPQALILVIVDKIDEYYSNCLYFLEVVKYYENALNSRGSLLKSKNITITHQHSLHDQWSTQTFYKTHNDHICLKMVRLCVH